MNGNEPGHAGTPRPRSVRSFVRRAGRLTASQQKALAELWPRFGIEFDGRPLDFQRLFGRQAPIVLEIGFGNGESLATQASGDPDRDFLGVEVHDPGIGHCLIRLRDLGLENLRVLAHDAIEVLEDEIPPHSLDRINLYFPDPWPKKRHHKRRIVDSRFLDLCARALRPGGTLHIATDWADYAEHIDAAIAAAPAFSCVAARTHDGEAPLDRPRTKFEQRGLRAGHRIRDWILATGR
ncbi:MAG TPA: tRNA (guanosine(46)-N7)-methyltransferase TrmB [Woeseiaceae bacterium]|nr:tRNA (guanosine(46)-N7)-methyltransferase TrmB [Woeseiaceae bacterium]